MGKANLYTVKDNQTGKEFPQIIMPLDMHVFVKKDKSFI